MRKPEFYSAVYGIIENEKGEILFQKRANTGFRDGEFQLPAGHIEGKETINNSLIRKMKEELDKCSELKFVDKNNIIEANLFSYDLDILHKIDKGEKFSEFVL